MIHNYALSTPATRHRFTVVPAPVQFDGFTVYFVKLHPGQWKINSHNFENHRDRPYELQSLSSECRATADQFNLGASPWIRAKTAHLYVLFILHLISLCIPLFGWSRKNTRKSWLWMPAKWNPARWMQLRTLNTMVLVFWRYLTRFGDIFSSSRIWFDRL